MEDEISGDLEASNPKVSLGGLAKGNLHEPITGK
jgi:hypothetical protein